MSDKTTISWTDATWNPVTGCTKVSAGCENCYIERTAPMRVERRQFRIGHRRDQGIGARIPVLLHPERLDQPARWRAPRRIFVCSLADLFHDEVPDEYIARVFAAMARAPQHVFQVLTKRPARARALLSDDGAPLIEAAHDEATAKALRDVHGWPLPNVHLGVSVENQFWADARIPTLLSTLAAVRWVSMEPLLGPVDLRRFLPGDEWSPDAECTKCGEQWWARDGGHEVVHRCGRDCPNSGPGCELEGTETGDWCDGPLKSDPTLDWVVVGGETGPGARPMLPEWARSIRGQCAAAAVPFHFKQWGDLVVVPVTPNEPGENFLGGGWFSTDVPGFSGRYAVDLARAGAGRKYQLLDDGRVAIRVGKKNAGRLLDGALHDAYPAAKA